MKKQVITSKEKDLAELIYKWRYLSIDNLKELTKTSRSNCQKILKNMLNKNLVFYHYCGITKYWFLSLKCSRLIGKEWRKNIKINFYELEHTKLMIKFVTKENININNYEIDLDLKKDRFWNEKFIPDIVYIDKTGKEIFVEVERTKKSSNRIIEKINEMLHEIINNNVRCVWITDNEYLEKYLKKILVTNFKTINDDQIKVETI